VELAFLFLSPAHLDEVEAAAEAVREELAPRHLLGCVAEGVVAAVKKVKLKIPLVVRLEGTNVSEGKALLKKSGIKMKLAESLWDAAQKAVASVGGRP
ncbi:MAG: FIST N-terminal domain-containing protein, partial [Elusimicrobiota bacterium]